MSTTMTRRAALSLAPAALLAAPAVAPDELRAAAVALGEAADRFRAASRGMARLEGDPDALAAYESSGWEPALDALAVAESRLLDAMRARGVPAVVAVGRLFIDTAADPVHDGFGGLSAATIVPMGGVVGL